jgi:hypothetical protein
MSKADVRRGSFGRHETFPLRFGWLTKGFEVLLEPDPGPEEDLIVRLGVGKNMVGAIKYWLQASRMARPTQRGMAPLDLGKALFAKDGFDPYLEDEATIWLLHWLIASNRDDATTIYWFFNRFHKLEFNAGQLLTNLKAFLADSGIQAPSDATLENDVSLLLRMYAGATASRDLSLEDSLDSPLSLLELISRADEARNFVSMATVRHRLPLMAVGYAIAHLFGQSDQRTFSLSQLTVGDAEIPGIGSVFRLTEDCLVAKIEQFLDWLPGHYELRETAGIRQLYQLEPLAPIDVVAKHFRRSRQLKSVA